jgi:hypothetical protein
VKTYINMPLDDLRDVYANYEYLLAIEKTSRDELAELSGREKIPEEALNRIKGLEATVTKLSAELETMRQDQERQYRKFIEQLKRITKNKD